MFLPLSYSGVVAVWYLRESAEACNVFRWGWCQSFVWCSSGWRPRGHWKLRRALLRWGRWCFDGWPSSMCMLYDTIVHCTIVAHLADHWWWSCRLNKSINGLPTCILLLFVHSITLALANDTVSIVWCFHFHSFVESIGAKCWCFSGFVVKGCRHSSAKYHFRWGSATADFVFWGSSIGLSFPCVRPGFSLWRW